MLQKRNVLQHLTRDELLCVVDRFELTPKDRRAKDGLIEAMAASKYAALGQPLNRLLSIDAYAAQSLWEKAESLAWPAYERLISSATLTNPAPPKPTDDLAWATFPMATDFASTLRVADEQEAEGIEGAGPWVDLLSVIRHQGLRLYSVPADISTEAGSKETSSAIRMMEGELRPKEYAA